MLLPSDCALSPFFLQRECSPSARLRRCTPRSANEALGTEQDCKGRPRSQSLHWNQTLRLAKKWPSQVVVCSRLEILCVLVIRTYLNLRNLLQTSFQSFRMRQERSLAGGTKTKMSDSSTLSFIGWRDKTPQCQTRPRCRSLAGGTKHPNVRLRKLLPISREIADPVFENIISLRLTPFHFSLDLFITDKSF